MLKLQRQTNGTPSFSVKQFLGKPGKEIPASISGGKGSLPSSKDSSIDRDTTALPGSGQCRRG
jgi:hypothetical protein